MADTTNLERFQFFLIETPLNYIPFINTVMSAVSIIVTVSWIVISIFSLIGYAIKAATMKLAGKNIQAEKEQIQAILSSIKGNLTIIGLSALIGIPIAGNLLIGLASTCGRFLKRDCEGLLR